MNIDLKKQCYCGHFIAEKSLPFEDCCKPFIEKKQKPATCEQLMRSRFSAFCLKDTAYLIDTLHASQRTPDDYLTLQENFNGTQWLGLKVIEVNDNTVEFCAFYTCPPSKNIEQLHERSEFIQEDGNWYYKAGIHLPNIKLGRNDTCYCGSGKKIKKCCNH